VIVVVLTQWEMIYVAAIGAIRHTESVASGRRDAHGCDGDDSLAGHVNGAGAECAVAKALDRYWSGHVGSFKGPDIGKNIQVRWRSNPVWDLIVRDDDPDDHFYFLVTGQAPQFMVHGCIMGRDARNPDWRKTHGGREAAFFVPQGALIELKERAA
jgi:hypothetical protein